MGFLDKLLKARRKQFVDIAPDELRAVAKDRKALQIVGHESAAPSEVRAFQKEVLLGTVAKKKKRKAEILPVHVHGFDDLVGDKGLERGSTLLISGGAGSGKTTFCLQSLYYSLVNNKKEKAIYISTEEEVGKLKSHMLKNFGWDFFKLEKEGRVAFLQLDPIEVARMVEAALLRQKQKLAIDFAELELPFTPDRIVLDSLSSLSIAFEDSENYRKYLRYLIKKLEKYGSLNFMIGETEQDPRVYSRAGIEEFLVDGVIVLYNLKVQNARRQAIEILKLRSSRHQKKIIPFEISQDGIRIFPEQQVL